MLDRKEQERRRQQTAHRLSVISLSVISREGRRSFVSLFLLFFFHIIDRTAESRNWQMKVRRRWSSLVLTLDPVMWSPKCKFPNRKQNPVGDQRKGCIGRVAERLISQSARSSPLAGQSNQRFSRKRPAPAPPSPTPPPACLPLQAKRFTKLKGSSLLTD